MADEKHAAAIFVQSLLQSIFRINIKMVGGLIKKKDVCLAVDQFTEPDFCLLASA